MRHVLDIALQYGMKVKFTSQYTPQMNGVAKKRLAVLKLRSQAMMNQVDLNKQMRNKLLAEAVSCANVFENITATSA